MAALTPVPDDRIRSTRERLLREGVVLCVRLSGGRALAEGVDVLCLAAARGGLPVLEITLTTPGAPDVLRRLSGRPDLLVGAGTVLTSADLDAAVAAGARFVMSPVYDAGLVRAAHARGVLAIPGAATPGEILAAWSGGATLVKVFPADCLGGPQFLRRVRGPLPDVPLIPTSGPTAENLGEYVAAGAAAVGVGADVISADRTPAEVEAAARAVRRAFDAARTRPGG